MKIKISTTIAFILSLSCLGLYSGSAASKEGYWPNFMGPHHNGTASGEILGKVAIHKIWETNVGIGFSSISVVGDRLYTIGNQNDTDTIYCLKVDNGQVIWKHSYPCKLNPNQYEGGPNSTPTYNNQRIYVLSKEGHIFCLDADNGKVIWSAHTKGMGIRPPRWGFSGSPVVKRNRVILAIGLGGAALDKRTGKVIWKSESGEDDKCYAAPLPFLWKNKEAMAFFVGNKLLAVDPQTGSQYWHIPWESKYNIHPASPAFIDDHMFVSAGLEKDCALYDLSGDTPKMIWQNKNLRNDFLNSIYYKGALFGISGSASRRCELVCLSPKTGKVLWKNTDIGFGSLLLIDGKLIVLSNNGVLFVAEANPDRYVEIAQKEILTFKCWTPPAFAGGTLFARNAAGDLVCVNLEKQ